MAKALPGLKIVGSREDAVEGCTQGAPSVPDAWIACHYKELTAHRRLLQVGLFSRLPRLRLLAPFSTWHAKGAGLTRSLLMLNNGPAV